MRDACAAEPPGTWPRPQWRGGSRLLGNILVASWAVATGLLAGYLIARFDADLAARSLPRLLEGLAVTVELAGAALVLGAALALPIALARLSACPWLATLATAYVITMRGTPLLAQVFLVYYGAGQFRPEMEAAGLWWFFSDAFNCALLTFTLNTAAYQAEILRGAIRSVPAGQWEAARALGLARPLILARVVGPQASILALRPLGNEIVQMIKGSAVASVITVYDLMGQTQLVFSRSFDFQVYLWAAIVYLAMVEVLRRIWSRLEARLTRAPASRCAASMPEGRVAKTYPET